MPFQSDGEDQMVKAQKLDARILNVMNKVLAQGSLTIGYCTLGHVLVMK